MKFRVVLHFLSPVKKKHNLLKTVPLHPFQLKELVVSGPVVVRELDVHGWTWLWWGLQYMDVQHVDVVEYSTRGRAAARGAQQQNNQDDGWKWVRVNIDQRFDIQDFAYTKNEGLNSFTTEANII